MRHNKKVNHLGRTSSHRKAMLANMAVSLIMHKRIKTTVAKAKALRGYVEPLITKGKNDTTHSRRTVFAYLKDKNAVTELFREVSVKIGDRPGGYTRILKLGTRLGDNADMCIIELVDYNTTYTTAKTETKQQAKRTRRGKSKKEEATTPNAETKASSKSKSVEKTVIEEVKEETTPEVEVETSEEPKTEEDNSEDTKSE
ncbi:MAG TPA: 50S ribosomal protein L17 [Tenuifilaceae bacterium]|nr:50S ribosomal protein L17 [Tenuifilaceae bacterium]HPE17535.1 50S ribosomal protein L17 [Tenuifilaceae bacterium]HPJ45779.1 50S ribosomal protein L17 [Tenuifilaceae bacterium]HPQ34017.1 50S ribosomal protein L17 [Tenuifilaceae bacterium]HRX68176.1 50S ribosomal protein L17 [Tenuifilaceae bacterium]